MTHQTRVATLRQAMADRGIDVALITDEDNVYYLTGYFDYLHMEFGRPTIFIVPRSGPTLLITPTIDLIAAEANARVDRIAPWNDGIAMMEPGRAAIKDGVPEYEVAIATRRTG